MTLLTINVLTLKAIKMKENKINFLSRESEGLILLHKTGLSQMTSCNVTMVTTL